MGEVIDATERFKRSKPESKKEIQTQESRKAQIDEIIKNRKLLGDTPNR